MKTVIVGAGLTGLYSAIALARRGHQVTIVDRDPGPDPDGAWPRPRVLQFHQPHAFRPQVTEALLAEVPDVWDALLAAGVEPWADPRQPNEIGFRSRRLTVERVLRTVAEAEPGITFRVGHAEEVIQQRRRPGGVRAVGARVAGVRVDGVELPADLVLDASGRSGRFNRGLRAPAEISDAGIAYVSRQYQLLPGAEPGPMNGPIGMMTAYPAYLTILFLHENGVFSTLILGSSDDDGLAGLRLPEANEAATRAIPALAEWTDPGRARPIRPMIPGGRNYNSYQGQLDDAGRVAVPGLIFVGDAVCITNPTPGRGVATSLMQAQRLLDLLDEHGDDFVSCSLAFDGWCTENIRPWFDDHVYADAEQGRRWAGADIDLSRPLSSNVIVAAATQADPSLMRAAGPYLNMRALPNSLAVIEPRAREIYASGWRPPTPAGPSRDELAEIVSVATRGATRGLTSNRSA